MSVKRIWHGWTTPENADLYQELLHQEVFPGIESKGIEGYRSVELLTIMTFDSIKRWDKTAVHYTAIEKRSFRS
jgi:hypothetical protein